MSFSASALTGWNSVRKPLIKMAEKERLWELLAKQYGGEISEEELRELQLLLRGLQDTMPYGDLLSELKGLAFRPGADDLTAKNKSLSALMQTIREKGMGQADDIDEEPAGKGRLYVWVAAALVLIIVIGVLIRKTGKSAAGAEPFDRIVTKAGSKTLINLPDSSTVVL